MRKYPLLPALLVLLSSLLLSGCIKQSNSYYLSDERDHALSVRAEQEYLWSKSITLSLVAANLPDCQRAVPLEKIHQDDVAVELFTTGENIFTIRSGEQLVQLDLQSCTQLAEPPPTALGQPVGVFFLGSGEKMLFEPAAAAATAPGAASGSPAGTPALPPAATPVTAP